MKRTVAAGSLTAAAGAAIALFSAGAAQADDAKGYDGYHSDAHSASMQTADAGHGYDRLLGLPGEQDEQDRHTAGKGHDGYHGHHGDHRAADRGHDDHHGHDGYYGHHGDDRGHDEHKGYGKGD
ncbi:hypothetical protein LP52_16845 [Streptomonospora alba]|uniref:Uncharacterized protein n=1 Tax=Streptomonospora alba TaxID=183763 RepID=A0A0C2G355_9ACTN|nr:hypothetical protein LP52_16845 [Streptomonospora alba]